MTQDGGEYDITPPSPPPAKPKPGDPDWVEPVPIIEKADPEPAAEEPPPDPDVEKNKGIAILGYFFFVFPLVLAPQSKFARFHANQALLVFIMWCAALVTIVLMDVIWRFLGTALDQIKLLYVLFACIFYLLPLVLVIVPMMLMVMGIIHAANGEKKNLPLVGHWTLLK